MNTNSIKTFARISLLSLAALTSWRGDAAAVGGVPLPPPPPPNQYHGTQCAPATPTDASRMLLSQYGVAAPDTGPVTVLCPALPVASATGRIGITAYDRKIDDTPLDPNLSNVACDAFGLDGDGRVLSSAHLATTGNAPGPQPVVSNPISFVGVFNIILICTIPIQDIRGGSGGFSHLASYRVLPP